MSEELKLISNFYKSFSGTDTLVFILMPGSNPVVLGSITTVSYSAYRTKQPVVNLGRTFINGMTRGTRIYAGTMIFTLINQHWLNELAESESLKWLKAYKDLKADELPLFDLMIVSANEYGSYVSMFIYGVDITDEGQVISVEDLFTENTLSFVARDIESFKAGSITGKQKESYSSESNLDKTINQTEISGIYITNDSNINNIPTIENDKENNNTATNSKEKNDIKSYIKDVVNKGKDLFEQAKELAKKEALKNFRELQYIPNDILVGDDVGFIQEKLEAPITYMYDSNTANAVKMYQSQNGLKPTGVVDSETYLKLLNDTDAYETPSGIVINQSGARVYSSSNINSSVVDILPYDTIIKVKNKVKEGSFYDYINGKVVESSGNTFYQIEQGYVNVNDVYSYEFSNKDIQFPTIEKNASGPYVTLLQELLEKIYGNFSHVEGVYDLTTRALVQKIQEDNNIACELGVVNEDTWRVIQNLTGATITDITNENVVALKVANTQGEYNLTSLDLGTDLFKGFDLEITPNKDIMAQVSAIAYYENGSPKILNKGFNIKALESKKIPFVDTFQNLLVYDITNNGYPNKVEYMAYLYNGDFYKWIINYRGE